jgi:HK97 gp10 family phage protein
VNTLTLQNDHRTLLMRLRSRHQRAVEGVMKDAAEQSRSLCPKKSGNLAASIGSGPSTGDGLYGVGAAVYSDVGYAPYVEYGTDDTPAQPFFAPVVQQLRVNAVARIKSKLG